MQFDSEPYEVTGRILPAQDILLSEGKPLRVGENGQFFFKERIASPLPLDKWILVHTEKDAEVASGFVDTLYRASSTFGITVDYPSYGVSRGIKAKDFIDAITDQMQKVTAPQIVVCILPPPATNEYAAIKRFAVNRSPVLLTQMVKSKTLSNPKNAMAVCSKMVLQMNAKRNGDLWKLRIPAGVPRKSMFVGIDISKEGKYECMGFSSSYDPCFAKYYTQVMQLKDKLQLNTAMGPLMIKALEKFHAETKGRFLPDLLVIFRDGLAEMLRSSVLYTELQSILTSISARYPDYKPKLVYAAVQKKNHTRYFVKSSSGRGLENPHPGTVVDSGITTPGKYEFLLMPQHVNEGTGTPAKISVLYDTSGMAIDVMEELVNALCYGYFNWQGAIRTPAPCKYAFSHSRLIAKYVHAQPVEALLPYLYFLEERAISVCGEIVPGEHITVLACAEDMRTKMVGR